MVSDDGSKYNVFYARARVKFIAKVLDKINEIFFNRVESYAWTNQLIENISVPALRFDIKKFDAFEFDSLTRVHYSLALSLKIIDR